jgi:hypothetical protein
MIKNFCKLVVDSGGEVLPLIVPSILTGGTGIMNPSVFVDTNGVHINLRVTNYTLYHSEGNQQFYSTYGPLVYMNPENDNHLRTTNYISLLNKDLKISDINKVDTSKFDDQTYKEAEFIGLEDGRLVKWDNKYFLCGVRRDADKTQTGRIEMSEVDLSDPTKIVEINRYRLEPPTQGSKCEKNWMPILDMPYHFVKWTNPLEVIKVYPEEGRTETVILHHDFITGIGDIRGGSQVVTIGEYRMCIIHEVNLFNSLTKQKDAKYTHRIVVWDLEWNFVCLSEPFSFMQGEIEFCCGLAVYGKDLLITFGFQDNAAYLLKMSINILKSLGINLEIKQPIIENKFEPVYCITHDKFKSRQANIKNQFKKLGLTDINFVIADTKSDSEIKVTGKYVASLDRPTLLAIASHLRTIKQWYDESDSPYAIFLEDDALLDSMKYWSFKWHDFVVGLPKDWDCIQMSCVRGDLNEIKLRGRKWDDWSVTAYMLTREYAGRLINQYIKGDALLLEIPDSDVQPLAENLIYYLGNIYIISLFTEDVNFKSTSNGSVLVDEHKPNHVESAMFINEWWKNNGLITNLKDLLCL